MLGTVIFYSTKNRYGFIKAKKVTKDVFFSKKSLADPEEILPTNARVMFENTELPDGRYKAKNIKRIA